MPIAPEAKSSKSGRLHAQTPASATTPALAALAGSLEPAPDQDRPGGADHLRLGMGLACDVPVLRAFQAEAPTGFRPTAALSEVPLTCCWTARGNRDLFRQRRMVMLETHVLTFSINKPFEEWVTTYDSSASLQEAAGIQSLFRGVSKDDPTKVCAVMQAEAGVMEQFISGNAAMIASSGHILESTVSQVFL